MRRPTILFMNRVYPPVRGASGRVLKDLARSFAREGWHVTVIASSPNGGEIREEGVRIINVKGPEKPKGMIRYMWIWLKMMVIALRLKKRHVLVTLSDPPLLVFAGHLICKVKGSKHIHWSHDLYPEVLPALDIRMPGLMMRLFRKIRHTAMRNCEKVIVTGRCMAKYLTKDGVDARKIAMVANWPDLELTDPEMYETTGKSYVKPDTNLARPFEKLLKAKQRFRVLYAGNIGLAHPIDTILDVAEMLEKRGSDIEFVFVGDGARFDYIAAQRSERGLDNIRVLPYQPNSRLREIMESGDIHLISLHDKAAGFVVPSKLYSALAVARPCIFIGPQQSETAKVIRDFETGCVVSSGDAQGLLDAIVTYRENGETWFAAHRGAVIARDVYTPQESIEAWMEHAWDAVKDELQA